MCVYQTGDELDNRSFVRERERRERDMREEKIHRRPACYRRPFCSTSFLFSFFSLYSEQMKQVKRKKKKMLAVCVNELIRSTNRILANIQFNRKERKKMGISTGFFSCETFDYLVCTQSIFNRHRILRLLLPLLLLQLFGTDME